MSLLLLMGIIALGFVYYRLNNDLYAEPIVQKYTKYFEVPNIFYFC